MDEMEDIRLRADIIDAVMNVAAVIDANHGRDGELIDKYRVRAMVAHALSLYQSKDVDFIQLMKQVVPDA